jgi:hypothetical protein
MKKIPNIWFLEKHAVALVCVTSFFCSFLANAIQGKDSLYDAIRQKIHSVPITISDSPSGKKILTWRRIKLKNGTGRKYGLADQFFGDHVSKGDYAPFRHQDLNRQSDQEEIKARKIGYIIRGKLILISLEDIIEDRGYDLEMLRLLKIISNRNEPSIDFKNELGVESNSKQKNLVELLQDSGYVTEPEDAELVDDFLQNRISDKDGRAALSGETSTRRSHVPDRNR